MFKGINDPMQWRIEFARDYVDLMICSRKWIQHGEWVFTQMIQFHSTQMNR